MSDSPIRDWLARLRPRPVVRVHIHEAHEVTRAPGNFGVAENVSETFQRQSATQENNLLVTLFSAFDAVVTLTGLIHRPNNQFTPIGPNGSGFALAVKGDRSLVQFALTLGSSIAIANLNAVVSSATQNIPVNACWCIVQQTRPQPDGTSVVTATLMSGPVTLLQPLAYPGSPIQKTADSTGFTRVLDVTQPAPGQEITIVVPQGARWQPNTLHFKCATNATAGAREILLRYTSGVTLSPQTEFTVEAQGSLQPASTTCQYAYGFTLSPQVSTNFGTGAASSTRQQGLPGNRFLLSGEAIVTQTANLQIGDQYSGIVVSVTEVLDPTAPSGAITPILTWTGTSNSQQNLLINPIVQFAPGVYTLTINTASTFLLRASAGGGGGTTLGDGGGGGGGASHTAGLSIQLQPGKSYALTVGAGGNAGVAGGQSKFVNSTDVITLLDLGGGGFGSGGASGGAGGVVATGAGALNGGNGGGSQVQGQSIANGCGGGGGGGPVGIGGANGGDGSAAHGNGGAVGVNGGDVVSARGGPSAGGGQGGGGGAGGGATAPGVSSAWGGGGGGAGSSTGGGGSGPGSGHGGDGIGVFTFQSAP